MNYITKFKENKNGKDYFVGDLHGCYDLFMAELDKVSFNKEVDRMFSVGDLIDRGPDSVKCLELLNEPWFFAVIGNHEDFLLGSHDWRIWMWNGGGWSADFEAHELQAFRDLVREKMYPVLEVETALGSIGVVHAESAEYWDHNCLLYTELNRWARSKYQRRDRSDIKNIDKVVVGHTITESVRVFGNVLYIDTGSYYYNNITILTVEDIFR